MIFDNHCFRSVALMNILTDHLHNQHHHGHLFTDKLFYRSCRQRLGKYSLLDLGIGRIAAACNWHYRRIHRQNLYGNQAQTAFYRGRILGRLNMNNNSFFEKPVRRFFFVFAGIEPLLHKKTVIFYKIIFQYGCLHRICKKNPK